jgi:hypothetical protein
MTIVLVKKTIVSTHCSRLYNYSPTSTIAKSTEELHVDATVILQSFWTLSNSAVGCRGHHILLVCSNNCSAQFLRLLLNKKRVLCLFSVHLNYVNLSLIYIYNIRVHILPKHVPKACINYGVGRCRQIGILIAHMTVVVESKVRKIRYLQSEVWKNIQHTTL